MKYSHPVLVALLSLTCTFSAAAQGNKPKAGTLVEAEDVLKAGQFSGKIGKLADNVFTLQIEIPKPQMAQGGNQGNQLARAQQQLARARTPQQRIQAVQALQRAALQAGTRNIRYSKETLDIEMDMATQIDVRTSFLPVVYDEMGNLKKYSAEEIRKLKAGSGPGYKAEVSSLRTGQVITVTLAKNKTTDGKLQATRILVLQESDKDESPRPEKKK